MNENEVLDIKPRVLAELRSLLRESLEIALDFRTKVTHPEWFHRSLAWRMIANGTQELEVPVEFTTPMLVGYQLYLQSVHTAMHELFLGSSLAGPGGINQLNLRRVKKSIAFLATLQVS